jgi:plasmid stability protein
MEAEAREILGMALHDETVVPLEPRALADWLDAVLGDRKPTGVVDEFIRERHEEAAKEDEEWLRSTHPSH